MTRIEQAGAIAYRESDGGMAEFLVVTARRAPSNWIFPKGHVEAGETLEEASLRELSEEGGVDGILVAPVGTSDFVLDDTTVSVAYYLVRATTESTPKEGRAQAWLAYDAARERLTFDDTRAHLDCARAWLES